ncbi:MAG TPA: histidine phosphatase family protein [Nitrospiraceae bacterium]|nr:histidine phosphatase family protein [Nitrospiraceae bacterium]
MDCMLFRHGVAIERDVWEGVDSDRPLTEKGAKKARQAGEGLLQLDVRPTHLLSSPLVRAHETAKLLQELFRPRLTLRICDELLPDAPPDKLFALLASLPPEVSVICVGHEPHLGDTAGCMIVGKPAAGLALKKAGACLIHFSEGMRPGRGVLEWWLTAGQLRSLR